MKMERLLASAARRAGWSALLVGLAAGPWGVALAAPPGDARVLMVRTQRHADVGSIAASRISTYLETVLGMSANVQLLTPDALDDEPAAPPPAVAETDPTLLRADAAVERAKEEVAKRRYMPATRTYREALRLYEERLDALENFDKYVDAQLERALAFFLAGYDDNGEEDLARVLVMRPTLVLDRRQAPAGAVRALERLQNLWSKATTEPVTIEATPAGATVFLNGRLIGPAPQTVSGLYRGRHWVRVVADGHEPWAGSVDAGPRARTVTASLTRSHRPATPRVATHAASPEAMAEAARTGAFGPRFDSAAKALCERHGLAGVVLTWVAPRPQHYEVHAFYFDGASGRLAEVDSVRVDLELSTLQVAVLDLAERLAAAIATFPEDRRVTGTPAAYQVIPKAGPPPGVAVAPVPPEPTPTPPEPTPPPVTVPEPTPPTVAVPEPVEPDPPVAVTPTPEEPPRTVIARDPARDGRDVAGVGVGPGTEVRRVDDGTGEVSDAAFYETWWFWTIVGAALVGGGAATYFALQDSGGGTPSGFRTTVSF